jgi:hypothetical protein
MNNPRQTSRLYIAAAALTVLTVLIGPINLRILTAFMPPAEAGLWILMISAMGYVSIFDFGLNQGILERLSVRRSRTIKYTINLLRSQAKVLIAQLFIIFLIDMSVFYWIHSAKNQHSQLISILWTWGFISATMLVAAINNCGLSILIGVGRVFEERMLRTLFLLLCSFAVFVSLRNGGNIVSIGAVWLTSSICISVYGIIRIYCYCGFIQIKKIFKIKKLLTRRDLSRGVKYLALNLGGLLILQSHSIVISSAVGLQGVLHADIIVKIVMVFITVSTINVQLNMPLAVGYSRARDNEKAAEIIQYANYRSLVLGGVLYAGFLLNYSAIMRYMFGLERFPDMIYAALYGLVLIFEVNCYSLVAPLITKGFGAVGWLSLGSGFSIVLIGPIVVRKVGVFGLPIIIIISQMAWCYIYIITKTGVAFNIDIIKHYLVVGRGFGWISMIAVLIFLIKQLFANFLHVDEAFRDISVAMLTIICGATFLRCKNRFAIEQFVK